MHDRSRQHCACCVFARGACVFAPHMRVVWGFVGLHALPQLTFKLHGLQTEPFLDAAACKDWTTWRVRAR